MVLKSLHSVYRNPRTRHEARHNQAEYEEGTRQNDWCRPKRRPSHLPTTYDDRPHCFQKSWKKFRRTKYRGEKRGTEHQVFLEGWRGIYRIEEHFRSHNIPYKMERVTESYTYKVPIRSKKVACRVPNYIVKYIVKKDSEGKKHLVLVQQRQVGYKDVVEWAIIGYQNKQGKKLLGYNLVWWSDKDIGINFILKQRGF